MKKIERFTDLGLEGWCIHCARSLYGCRTYRDHVPTRNLLRPPAPAGLPVVEICQECDERSSWDEDYFVAFLSTVVSGSTEPAHQVHESAMHILQDQPLLRTRIERGRLKSAEPSGETRAVWTPEAERIERVILKNARGHAFFEYGEPMLSAPVHIRFMPLANLSDDQLIEFDTIPESRRLPDVGSRMLTRVLTGQEPSGPWVAVQEGVYRYAAAQVGAIMLVRSVIFEYLATEVYWDLEVYWDDEVEQHAFP
jgi:hypothetical protein